MVWCPASPYRVRARSMCSAIACSSAGFVLMMAPTSSRKCSTPAKRFGSHMCATLTRPFGPQETGKRGHFLKKIQPDGLERLLSINVDRQLAEAPLQCRVCIQCRIVGTQGPATEYACTRTRCRECSSSACQVPAPSQKRRDSNLHPASTGLGDHTGGGDYRVRQMTGAGMRAEESIGCR